MREYEAVDMVKIGFAIPRGVRKELRDCLKKDNVGVKEFFQKKVYEYLKSKRR